MDFVKEAWFWQLPDGRVWSTAAAAWVTAETANAWARGQGLTEIPPSPVDEAGERTEKGLYDALVFYGLPVGELAPPEHTVQARMAAIDAQITVLELQALRPLLAMDAGIAEIADMQKKQEIMNAIIDLRCERQQLETLLETAE
ncbi:hypothetical protein [Desulfovibrio cuneatus]|uniref:hypothetical protein n=1 Tax=Desulfovibrio cuneatus TaxID=159728 RepID=UPI00041F9999|nr:hypothetical protein [Desulfovibrio cuneatus]